NEVGRRQIAFAEPQWNQSRPVAAAAADQCDPARRERRDVASYGVDHDAGSLNSCRIIVRSRSLLQRPTSIAPTERATRSDARFCASTIRWARRASVFSAMYRATSRTARTT